MSNTAAAQEEYQNTQIIRKDGKDCFLEVKSDAFGIGKMHFEFAAYDMSKPKGSRFTNHTHIYIDIPEFLQLSNEITSGRLHKRMMETKAVMNNKSAGDADKKNAWLPLYSSMGGTPAERLREPRKDGMGVSRTIKITAGSKKDYLVTAESGPGEANEKGLIVPRYGNKPEHKVTVALTWRDLEQITLTATTHYTAWLSVKYVREAPR